MHPRTDFKWSTAGRRQPLELGACLKFGSWSLVFSLVEIWQCDNGGAYFHSRTGNADKRHFIACNGYEFRDYQR